jgi:hypothetical protein
MLKVEMRKNEDVMCSDGVVRAGHRTLLRPVRTRRYRGNVATVYFNENRRNQGILDNRSITYTTA